MSYRTASIRFVLTLTLLTGCVSGFAAPASRIHKKDAKHEIEELEQQWKTASINADVASMDKLLSDDYIGISMTGQINTKEQQLDRLRNRSLILTTIDMVDVKVKLVGQVAIVTGLTDVNGTNDGASIKGEYRYTRIYQRLPSGVWKLTNLEVTRVPKALVGQQP